MQRSPTLDSVNVKPFTVLSQDLTSESSVMVFQRLAKPDLWSRDQEHRDKRVGLVIETETETPKVLRPRLIETKEFPSCRDRDLSRLDNLVVVKTETHRD